MFLLLLPAIFNWYSVASDIIQEAMPPFHLNQNDIVQTSLAHFLPGKPIMYNTSSYIDKAENLIRVPNITRHEGKKKLKKFPKRTINQKIIKKNKAKRKYYPTVTQPTQSKEKFEQYDIYAKEEIFQKNVSTPQTNQKKHGTRKWNKLSRYPMPFQKLNTNRDLQKNSHALRRNKRSEDREDLYILKDLDELEFLSKDKEYDVVKAHLQKHW